MRILFVQPGRDKGSVKFGEMLPYALLVLAQQLITQEVEANIRLIDLRVQNEDEYLNTLANFTPDLICITGITIDVPMMFKAAKMAKNVLPNTRITVGGHHATLRPNDFQKKEIDFIFRGPATRTFPELVNKLKKGEQINDIPGVIHKDASGKFIECLGWKHNIPKAPLPFVDYRDILQLIQKPKAYECFGYRDWRVITTTRGCKGRCEFCACWVAENGNYTVKPAEMVVREILSGIETGGRFFFLGDEDTFHDTTRAWKIFHLLSKELNKRGVKIFLDGYARAQTIVENEKLFKAWRSIGFQQVTVGYEALTDEKLRKLGKGSNTRLNKEANAILQRCKINNLAHFIIFPDFTEENFKEIWEYIYKLGITDPVTPVGTPLPGTVLWNKTKMQGINMKGIPWQYFDLGHPITPTALGAREFYRHLKWLILKNYSFTRWAIAKIKTGLNFFSDIFPENECRAPALLAIFYMHYWVWRELQEKKLQPFFDWVNSQGYKV